MKLNKRKKQKRFALPPMKKPGPPSYCPNCGEELTRVGHFVPPSLGERGFFICDKRTSLDPVERLCLLSRVTENKNVGKPMGTQRLRKP
jgi:hypothetical protein